MHFARRAVLPVSATPSFPEFFTLSVYELGLKIEIQFVFQRTMYCGRTVANLSDFIFTMPLHVSRRDRGGKFA